MRWMVPVVAGILLLTGGSASLIEDALSPTCSIAEPTMDTTDLCTYQYDFDTWGDARDDCLVTETGKHIIADGVEKDALFVLFDDQEDNVYIDFGGVGQLEVTYTPNAPVAQVWIEIEVTSDCGSPVVVGSGPSSGSVVAEQVVGNLTAGTYQLAVSAHTAEDLVEDLGEALASDETGDATDALADLLTLQGWIGDAEVAAGDLISGALTVGDGQLTGIALLEAILSLTDVTANDPTDVLGATIVVPTQCQPVCAGNHSDRVANPLVGYKLKARSVDASA